MAKDLAFRWIRTNYVAYKNTQEMHEKYNVEKCGDYGGGGEYVPQVNQFKNTVALCEGNHMKIIGRQKCNLNEIHSSSKF